MRVNARGAEFLHVVELDKGTVTDVDKEADSDVQPGVENAVELTPLLVIVLAIGGRANHDATEHCTR